MPKSSAYFSSVANNITQCYNAELTTGNMILIHKKTVLFKRQRCILEKTLISNVTNTAIPLICSTVNHLESQECFENDFAYDERQNLLITQL